jgi:flagellar basal-body rod modification protein FlgD
MTTIPAATTNTAAPPATSPTANGTDSTGTLDFTQNFDTFLTLLTTQLKNQDPLSPLDTNQFTQQLVMFSQVEQQIKTNSDLSTLIGNASSTEAISATPMIGRTIEYSGNQAALENGSAAFSYTLPTAAASAAVTIQDASGNAVFSGTVDPTAGQHNIVWNGQTNDGTQLADGGLYTIQVQAADANNAAITATTTATGAVTGVSVSNNVATFNVSGVQVPMNQLLTILASSSATTN